MIRVCASCPEGQNVLGEKPPYSNKEKTHGSCRFHALEDLERGKVITLKEKRELNAIRYKRLRMGAYK